MLVKIYTEKKVQISTFKFLTSCVESTKLTPISLWSMTDAVSACWDVEATMLESILGVGVILLGVAVAWDREVNIGLGAGTTWASFISALTTTSLKSKVMKLFIIVKNVRVKIVYNSCMQIFPGKCRSAGIIRGQLIYNYIYGHFKLQGFLLVF